MALANHYNPSLPAAFIVSPAPDVAHMKVRWIATSSDTTTVLIFKTFAPPMKQFEEIHYTLHQHEVSLGCAEKHTSYSSGMV